MVLSGLVNEWFRVSVKPTYEAMGFGSMVLSGLVNEWFIWQPIVSFTPFDLSRPLCAAAVVFGLKTPSST
jgi:hypothetical protein